MLLIVFNILKNLSEIYPTRDKIKANEQVKD
jgi:hypothetical protein